MPTFTLPPDVVKSSGPLILGYLLNWGLFGVVSIQVFYYYIAFPKDKLYCKCLVYGVYLLETLQTIIITHDAFASFGIGFGDFTALDSIQLTCLSIPILSGVVGCVVQLFYAYRINILSKTKKLGYTIGVVSIIGCIAGFVTGVKSFQLGSLSKLTETTVFISAGLWWGCCALCDVTIALAMTYLLSRHDTGFRTTHVMITRLTRLTIETGTCTAVVAIINLGLFFGFPETNYYTVSVLIIAKFYCNTLLVLFNCRMRIVGGREEGVAINGTVDLTTASNHGQALTFNRPASAYLGEWRTPYSKEGVRCHDVAQDHNSVDNMEAQSHQGICVTTDVFVKKDVENHSPISLASTANTLV